MQQSNSKAPSVSILVGSVNDAEVIAGARRSLDDLGIPYEAKVLSAHRTPGELAQYAEALAQRGIKVVIAGAGMSAALAGVVAAHTDLPVLGVPIASGALAGVDALLSTTQMPPGVPVASMGIGAPGAKNAALLAARILALTDPQLGKRLEAAKQAMRDEILTASLPEEY